MKFKKFLLEKGYTMETFATLEATKQAELHTEFLDTLESVSKADFDALKEEMKGVSKSETVNGLTEKLEELALEVKSLEQKGTSNGSQWVEFESFVKEKGEELAKMKTQGSVGSFTLKAVEPVISTNVSTDAGGNVGAMTQSLGIVKPTADNQFFIESVLSGQRAGADALTWIDEVAKEGDAGMTAEGGTKSQSDVEYVEKTVVLENVTHFIKVSTKMLRQPSFIVDAIKNRLLRRLQLKKQSQLISGNGTAPQIKGIKDWATAFSAGTFAGTVIDANIADLIRVIVAQISTAVETSTPNIALVSHATLAKLDLKKGDDGHYALPPFSTLDGRTISGVRVVSSNEITDAELLVMDSRVVNYFYGDTVNVSMNLDGNDFTKNMRTILAEQTIALFVSSNETGAIVLVDDLDQALTDITYTEPEPSV